MYYTSVQLFFVKPQRTHLESGEKSLFPKIFNLINCSTKIERHRLFKICVIFYNYVLYKCTAIFC